MINAAEVKLAGGEVAGSGRVEDSDLVGGNLLLLEQLVGDSRDFITVVHRSNSEGRRANSKDTVDIGEALGRGSDTNALVLNDEVVADCYAVGELLPVERAAR